jgi:protein-disulfide isomerase
VERDDVRSELELVRRRRDEALRLEADLARQQSALEARLGAELDGDTPSDRAAVHESTRARLERAYGPLRSAADLIAVIHEWRRNIPSASSLWMQVQSNRDHLRGDPAAPLVVVEYGDYQCPECAEANALHARAKAWLEDGRVCFAFRHFPLIDAHPFALRAAQAVEAAAAQGRFWEMHDALMEHDIVTNDGGQEHVRLRGPRNAAELERVAQRAGLDLERFRADLDDPAAAERILDDFRGGLASGVNGTPTFYLRGERSDANGVDELYAEIGRHLDEPVIDA